MNEQLTQIYGYLHGMWRYRWLALLIAWAVALTGWFFVIAMPNQYSSRAVVYIDTTSVMKPLLKGLALETDSRDELRVMSRVMLSRENLLSVIRETDMDLEIESPAERENLVRELASKITVRGGAGRSKSNIYTISYVSISAERAFKVVSNLLNTMIEDTLNTTRTDTVMAQKFLDVQIAEHEQRLTLSEQQLAEFKKSNVGYMPDEKGGYYMRLQRAQDALGATNSALRLAKRRVIELNKQLKGEKPLLDSGSYGSATVLKIQRHQGRLDTLLNKFTEEHPDVQEIRSTIADLRDSMSAGVSAGDSEAPVAGGGDILEFNPVYQSMKVDLSKAGVEVETLKIRLAEQKRQVSKLKGSIDIIPEVEARLTKLNRDYSLTHKRYLDLVERREAAKLAQSAGLNSSDITFRVIEPPIVPLRPSGPKRLLMMTGVLLAAFGAGLVWSFVRYFLQPTFIDLQQVRLRTGLPVLGSVSLLLSPEYRKKRQMQLASFLSIAFLLVCAYGGTIYSVLA